MSRFTMFAFIIFILSSIQMMSTAAAEVQTPGPLKLPHSPFSHLSPPNKSSFHDWSSKTFRFQEPPYSSPAKSPQHPSYSSPWKPIDRQSTGYRSDAPRYSEYISPHRSQHTSLSREPSPSPAPRFPTQPAFDPAPNHFGGPQDQPSPQNPTQTPGFKQYDNHVQFSPSSYDVPLHAPMYERAPNEEYNQADTQLPALDWASLANALGSQQLAPAPQMPPNHRYKIVFIKTPRIPGLHPPTTPPPPPDQEKTLIYVLVNKPDYDPPTTPAPPPSTTPSKPEVYFIQYKTKANQFQTGNKVENGKYGADLGQYEGQDSYRSTFRGSKSIEANSL